MKTCGQCDVEQEADNFPSGKSTCRSCKAEASKAWRKKNPERAKASVARWRAANKETVCRWSRENYQRLIDKDPNVTRERSLKYKYGLTIEQYEAMASAQGGSCAICQRHLKLVVDHCHTDGKVRGLLCGACNSAIGLLRDDPRACRVAAQYLQVST